MLKESKLCQKPMSSHLCKDQQISRDISAETRRWTFGDAALNGLRKHLNVICELQHENLSLLHRCLQQRNKNLQDEESPTSEAASDHLYLEAGPVLHVFTL
ncbi:hypothetical protein GOODEAATRI_028954 [Goodea atripinnis]|uniref:Uncharacterized protein n=1 Tax=Goodea atripinnis TaxID=208336 RepID=A0ABV0MMU8_9TELE